MSERRRRSRLSLRRPAGILFWAVALAVFAGFIVPLIHANRFRRQIQTALEAALGRRVEIGDVTLHLLTGPGFRLENVVIGEDPAFGDEPIAYVGAMQARLRLRTLWTGQIQLSSLTLEEPSINLVKNAEGRWNFEPLMGRGSAESDVYFPYIGIDGGRVNFKFGPYKSVFHFRDVEAALSPPRDAGGRWWMRFGGRPARTDRLLPGIGRLRGEGSLSVGPDPVVHIETELAKTPMAYLTALTHGRDFGVHGDMAVRAQLSGPISRIRVRGALEVEGVHRWDLLPAQETRFTVPLRGEWSLAQQRAVLSTDPAQTTPVRVHFVLSNYLSAPQWTAIVELDKAPVEPIAAMAQHFGAMLSVGLDIRGSVTGRVEFGGSPWPEGEVTVLDGRVTLPDSPAVAVGPLRVKFSQGGFEALPAAVRVGKQAVLASAAGRWRPFRLDARVVTRDLSLGPLRRYAGSLAPPWLASLSSGVWEGRIFYRKEPGQPGSWSAAGTLSKALWTPAGLETPIEIRQARVRWEPGMIQLEPLLAAAGEVEIRGGCRGVESGFSCRVRVAELDVAQLGTFLQPRGSRWAVLRRALGGRSGIAPWLRQVNARGSVTIDRLAAGRWALRKVRANFEARHGVLVLSALRGELGRGSVTGAIKAEFQGASPRYSAQLAAKDLDLRVIAEPAVLPENFDRGVVDLRAGIATEGRSDAELRSNLRITGLFEGHSVMLRDVEWKGPQGEADESLEIPFIQGQFAWSRSGLELTRLQMTLGREVYEGRGSIGGQPQLTFDVVSGDKQFRLVAARAATPLGAEP